MCKEQNKEVFLEKKKECEKLEKLTIRLSKDKKLKDATFPKKV